MKKNKGTGNREQGTGEVAVNRGLINVEAVVQTVETLGQGMKISKDLAELAKDAHDDLGVIRRAATGAGQKILKDEKAEDLQGLLMSARNNLVDALLRAKTDPDVAESYLRCAEPFECIKNRNIIRLYYFYKGIVIAITSIGLAVCFKKGSGIPVIRYARKRGAK